MEAYGIILIKNDSDDFIDDVVFDLQISRNLDAVYPSDTHCDIKTVAAVVLDATTKTMSVSDTPLKSEMCSLTHFKATTISSNPKFPSLLFSEKMDS